MIRSLNCKVWILAIICLLANQQLIAQESPQIPSQDGEVPILFAASTSLTGNLAEFGEQQANGMRMWEADINQRGGLLGRPVKLLIADDRSRPSIARDQIGKFLRQNVQFFVSPYSSELTLAVQELVEEQEVAMMSVASAPEIWQRPNPRIFGLYTPADHNMNPVIKLAQDHGLKTIGLAYEDNDFAIAVAKGVRARAAQAGLTIAVDVAYPRDQPDFSTIVQQINTQNPDVVIVGSYFDDAVAFAKVAAEQKLSPKIMAYSGGPALRKFGEKLGYEQTEGILSTVQWMRSAHLPGAFDFGFRYQELHDIYPSYDAAGGYAALQVMEAAIRLADSVQPSLVRAQLAAMKFRSILGHYRVNELGAQTAKSTFLVQWQDRHISLVGPAQIARWPLRYPYRGN